VRAVRTGVGLLLLLAATAPPGLLTAVILTSAAGIYWAAREIGDNRGPA
jgi:hypothetical protein